MPYRAPIEPDFGSPYLLLVREETLPLLGLPTHMCRACRLPGTQFRFPDTQLELPETQLIGLYRGSIRQKTEANLLFFLSLFIVFVEVLWVLIIPKWLIKASGHIAILFGSFLELPKNHQIWSLAPFLITKTLQQIQKQKAKHP